MATDGSDPVQGNEEFDEWLDENISQWLEDHSRLQSIFFPFSVVPQEVEQLESLHRLYLGGDVEVLPTSVSKLEQLVEVIVSGGCVPKGLSQIPNLERLEIVGAGIQEVPDEVWNLDLRELTVECPLVATVDPSKAQMEGLRRLSIVGTPIETVPLHLENATQLEVLSLAGTRLKELPESIGELCGLQHLDISRTSIEVLPLSIHKLQQLRTLLARDSRLSRLPTDLGTLTNLARLDLQGSNIRDLPLSLSELKQLTDLNTADTSLPTSLQLVLQRRGLSGLMSWLKTEGWSPLREAKVLVLGEGGVGKTELVARLCGSDELVNRDSTHGIEIEQQRFETDDLSVLLRFWDFGGQPEYRVTHQYFYGPDTVYLVLWNGRYGPDQGDVNGWLERILHRVGPTARVIVVATHGADQNPELDIGQLNRKYQGLVRGRLHIVDSEDGRGIDDLTAALLTEVRTLQVVDELVPNSHRKLCEEIELANQPYLTWSSYCELAADCGLNSADLWEASAIYLAAAGRVTYFRDSVTLQGRVILNPEWLTTSFSYVLKSTSIKEAGGKVEGPELRALWENPPFSNAKYFYSPDEVAFLARLLEVYGVALRLGQDDYLIPQMLPFKRPEIPTPANQAGARRVQFELNLTAARPLLIANLICRLDRYLTDTYWRHGALLRSGSALAMLEMSDEGNVGLDVYGDASGAFFSELAASVRNRLADYVGLEWRQNPVCYGRTPEGDPCSKVWSADDLRSHMEAKLTSVFCPSCKSRELSIASLLSPETPRPSENTSVNEYQQTVRMLAAIGREITDTPYLVTIEPMDPDWRQWTPAHWTKERWQLRIWCDHPGEEHPCDAVYDFKKPKAWFLKARPYFKWAGAALRVLPVTRAALGLADELSETPVVDPNESIAGPDQPADLMAIARSVQVTEELGKLVATEEDKANAIPDSASPHVSIRIIRELLHDIGVMSEGRLVVNEPRRTEIDPTAAILKQDSSVTADGRFRWICNEHWSHYASITG